MKQVVQPVSGGPVEVLDVPRPAIGPTEVLVRTMASVISPGTERAVTTLAQSSLLAKARARPDLVRQVVRKARAEGLAATAQTVRSRLASDVPLGYSAAGLVVAAGAAVAGIMPGQLVATGGAGAASHAEFQAVPGLLCAVVPDGVPAQDAAFATLASIPLHALRLASVGPGSKVAILGLGLIGQLAARLAMAAGCDVAGIDPGRYARDTAVRSGVLALDESGDATTEAVLRWSRGRGADAVLVCAADSSAGPMSRAPALCRDRASVVMVGDVGMPPQRTPFYEREISLLFARSYGPGRYEPSYDAWGVDYPAGQVRWTEGRNQEAVLDLLAAGRLQVSDLVTQTFGIEGADAAYRLLEERTEPCMAIRLGYPADAVADEPVRLRRPETAASAGAAGRPAGPERPAEPGVGWIGAGAFSAGTLLPAFRQAGFGRFVAVATASGVSARRAAERHGFEQAVSGAAAVIGDPDVGVVVIATPHDTHEELARQALAAGRDVWCEKPLALSLAGLDEVEKAWRGSGRQLTLGFNRRWAPAALAARQALAGASSPKLVTYRVAAGRVPDGHWYLDRRQGGRLIGEVCHFVDLAQALTGADIEDATGVLSGDASAGNDSVVVALRFADGSVASVTYGSTPPVAGKERVEVLAGSHQVVIDDFRSVQVNGRTRWRGRADKGHRAHAAAFRRAVQAGRDMPAGVMPAGVMPAEMMPAEMMPTEAMLGSMRATLTAVDRMLAP
jgi:predicted dehydrogenase/threonine dehydrogenase-like Zn-dependent dehydrogenase